MTATVCVFMNDAAAFSIAFVWLLFFQYFFTFFALIVFCHDAFFPVFANLQNSMPNFGKNKFCNSQD